MTRDEAKTKARQIIHAIYKERGVGHIDMGDFEGIVCRSPGKLIGVISDMHAALVDAYAKPRPSRRKGAKRG